MAPLWTYIRVLNPQFGETVHIYEVNGARKVKCNAKVAAMNKNSDTMHKFLLRGGWGGQ